MAMAQLSPWPSLELWQVLLCGKPRFMGDTEKKRKETSLQNQSVLLLALLLPPESSPHLQTAPLLLLLMLDHNFYLLMNCNLKTQ